VYVLPDSPGGREDFEWLRTEITSAGGEVSIFTASSVDAWNDDALVEAFRRARQEAYAALADDLEARARAKGSHTRRRATKAADPRRTLAAFRDRLAAIQAIDFFGAPGRERVLKLLAELEERETAPGKGDGGDVRHASTAEHRRRLWVTRPSPGVDRMSSAWLIRTFIDPDARFGFVADRHAAPANALPFDMFGVEFTHRDQRCTFEVLRDAFGLTDPALTRIGAIVHDLDLRDGRFGAPEAATVGLLVEGVRRAHEDDEARLASGMALFDALFRACADGEQETVRAPRAAGAALRRRQSRRSSKG
jgi:hypothetical protein